MQCPKCHSGEIMKVMEATVYTKYAIDDNFETTYVMSDEDWGDQYFDHYECDGCGATWDNRDEVKE